MYVSTISDQDLGDLIAYLKQTPPVDTGSPTIIYGPFLPIAPALGIFAPAAELIDHNAPHPEDAVPGATIENGKYLTAICAQCHGTGISNAVKNWKQEDFIRTFNTGVLPDGRQLGPTMPSKTFNELNDTVLVFVESSDILFAVDSIPAIFAITTDPFIVFSSNAFAILGLRSLYFLLAGLIGRFVYLKQGLAALLVFAGAKILISEFWKMPVALSLAVIVGIITVSVVASWLATRRGAAPLPLPDSQGA